MSGSYTVADRTLSTSFNPRSLSSPVLAYLRSIASSERPLSTNQLHEFRSYTSTAHHNTSSTPTDHPSGTTSHETSKERPTSSPIDLEQFLNYMTSSMGDASETLPEQDLSYPISNYFINSSHNTYLTGNQLYSESISLEVHAGKEQQGIMVEIIEQVWKGLLVEPLSGACEQLPSPNDLRRKILIKVKYVAPEKVTAQVSTPSLRRKKSASSSSDSDDQGSEDVKKTKKSSIIKSLSALGVYTRSYHFKDLSSPEASAPCHVFSLSEKKFMDVHETLGPTLFSHNRNYLMRAFPSGTRISSSNLDPAVFWRSGVQIVALNWQKYDAGMMLNEGMFAGTPGWVLKPKEYRGQHHDQNAVVSNESQGDAIAHQTLFLSIQVLAAHNLPLPTGDRKPDGFRPYVKCELHVERPEERTSAPIEGGGKSKDGEYKTKTKTSRGIDPDFGGERTERADFLNVPGVVEELSFVR
ncbi:MAG: hypothetical protein Q9196_004531 [Gyalolechia fulgens]